MSKLKPCPFCGGEADFDYDDFNHEWIYCMKCGTSTDTKISLEFSARDELSELWNTRASGWISFDKKLPRAGEAVDLMAKNGKRLTDFRFMIVLGVFRSLKTGAEYGIEKFTHWMPLPEPPKD